MDAAVGIRNDYGVGTITMDGRYDRTFAMQRGNYEVNSRYRRLTIPISLAVPQCWRVSKAIRGGMQAGL
jgi:hypothetical protein